MATEQQQVVPPGQAAITYTKQFYAILEKRAKLEIIVDDPQTDEMGTNSEPREVLVFRGQLSDVFRELKVSQTFYSKIRAILIEYDCVTYLQRGTRAYDSVLLLNHPPPEEVPPEVLTRPSDPATLSAVADALESLSHSVSVLEKWRESTGGINISEALRNMELRLARLEKPTEAKANNKREN